PRRRCFATSVCGPAYAPRSWDGAAVDPRPPPEPFPSDPLISSLLAPRRNHAARTGLLEQVSGLPMIPVATAEPGPDSARRLSRHRDRPVTNRLSCKRGAMGGGRGAPG